MSSKIVIVMQGGVIRSVVSDGNPVEVLVLDYDLAARQIPGAVSCVDVPQSGGGSVEAAAYAPECCHDASATADLFGQFRGVIEPAAPEYPDVPVLDPDDLRGPAPDMPVEMDGEAVDPDTGECLGPMRSAA